jgi:uncharacterized membrane protein
MVSEVISGAAVGLQTASQLRIPIHPMLVPFPIVCFIGALATDAFQAKTKS